MPKSLGSDSLGTPDYRTYFTVHTVPGPSTAHTHRVAPAATTTFGIARTLTVFNPIQA